MPQAEAWIAKIAQGDGASRDDWFTLFVDPAEVQLDRRVASAGITKVFSQGVHALEVSLFGEAWPRAGVSDDGGKATTAFDVRSCDIEE
jgi:hypothetical protein